MKFIFGVQFFRLLPVSCFHLKPDSCRLVLNKTSTLSHTRNSIKIRIKNVQLSELEPFGE